MAENNIDAIDFADLDKQNPKDFEYNDPEDHVSTHNERTDHHTSQHESVAAVQVKPQEVSAPPSAYALFMKSLKDNEEFQASLTDKRNFLSLASKRWKEMSEQEKSPFYKQHESLKAEYDEYQQEM